MSRKTHPKAWISNEEWIAKTQLAIGIAHPYGVTMDELCSNLKTNDIVRAREAVYIAFRDQGWSYLQLARFMRKDHSSILLAERRARQKAAQQDDTDPGDVVCCGHDDNTNGEQRDEKRQVGDVAVRDSACSGPGSGDDSGAGKCRPIPDPF